MFLTFKRYVLYIVRSSYRHNTHVEVGNSLLKGFLEVSYDDNENSIFEIKRDLRTIKARIYHLFRDRVDCWWVFLNIIINFISKYCLDTNNNEILKYSYFKVFDFLSKKNSSELVRRCLNWNDSLGNSFQVKQTFT